MTWCAGFDRSEWETLPIHVRVQLAAYDLRRYSYGRSPVWPYWRPGLPRTTATALEIDCSSATAYLACTVYPEVWDAEAYGDLQTFADRYQAGRVWCSLEAWQRCAGAELLDVDEEPTRPGWYACQGWAGDSGHAFMVGVLRGGVMVRLHSTARHGIGPEYRRDSWAELRASYSSGVRAARLR